MAKPKTIKTVMAWAVTWKELARQVMEKAVRRG
jgi:hypothetical protein